jgi:hypothetical protein
MDHPQSFHDAVEHWKTKNQKPDGTYPSCSTENGRLELIAECRRCYPGKDDAAIQNTISRVVKTAVSVYFVNSVRRKEKYVARWATRRTQRPSVATKSF